MNYEIDNVWSKSSREILEKLQVEQISGLPNREIQKRRDLFGSNKLREFKKASLWGIFVNQFKSIIILLLVVAAIVSMAFGQITEGIAIVIVIVINTTIGFGMEVQAVRSMEALRKLGSARVQVRRDGKVIGIHAEELVPGDIVILEGGDVITADLRIIESSKLEVNESTLTGESLPVSKKECTLDESTILAERHNMLFKGTSLNRGSGEAVVVSTGMKTELGKISALIEKAQRQETPLEKRLSSLGRKLVWVTLIIAALIAIMGFISGTDFILIIETSIALAVATVPEGLPIVATIALARGMWRMAEKNALVKRLAAVETLGATNIICTDKTGTLTENRLTVNEISLSGENIVLGSEELNQKEIRNLQLLKQTMLAATLCNNATYYPHDEDKSVGDPLEIALLKTAHQIGFYRTEISNKMPEKREDAFDSESKRMATYNQLEEKYLVSVKGAPENIIEYCDFFGTLQDKQDFDEKSKSKWNSLNEKMAADGLRVLAIAGKETDDLQEEPYSRLNFFGLIGLLDPPRMAVKDSLESCKSAGIKVVMITGDHPVTALKISLATGLVDDNTANIISGKDLLKPNEIPPEEKRELLNTKIFARVDPAQKLDLISYYQEDGSIVAMTGDGVNDAPALKKADIGVAMGKRGTQVAQEAADVVLKEDDFSIIVSAIREGRVIFGNIRKFVLYLLSCNVSEILAVGIASTLPFLPLPILPLQILFLNLVTDVFPALALGVGEGSINIMHVPPRKAGEPILTRKHWFSIFGYGILITISVLATLFIALKIIGMDKPEAVTLSFLTLATAQLWHAFNMRASNSHLLKNEITRNPWLWSALLLCIILLLVAIYIPGLAGVLHLVKPSMDGWILVIVMSLFPLLVGQLTKIFAPQTDIV